jgi:hypothetical protein
MSIQFNKEDHEAVKAFLGLLVNLGLSPTEAYKKVKDVLSPLGWTFVYFNDIEDFWIIDNEMK